MAPAVNPASAVRAAASFGSSQVSLAIPATSMSLPITARSHCHTVLLQPSGQRRQGRPGRH